MTTDEEVVSEQRLKHELKELLGEGVFLEIIQRKKRSERVTLRFPEGGKVSFAARTTRPGASRAGLLRFLRDLRRVANAAIEERMQADDDQA